MKTRSDAEKLAALMEKIGKAAGKKCRAVVTDMDMPLGNNIGNALEVEEAIDILSGKTKGRLYGICISLTADILELAGKGSYDECVDMAKEVISSGKALDIFRRTVELHGGNPDVCEDTSLLPHARFTYKVKVACDMKISSFDTEELGMVSLLLGAGRIAKDDRIDMSAGIIMNTQPGDVINAGDTMMTLCSTVCSDFSDAAMRAVKAVRFEKINCQPPLT
jgi:pyrimidine-nucleoside phosphorylase